MKSPTSHFDTFANDNLPSLEEQADCLFTLDALRFPESLNCATELLDKKIKQGLGGNIAIKGDDVSWTYQDLLEKSNQVANYLVEEVRLITGNRILLRSPNNPMLAAFWLGILKAGGIVVSTMPLLRVNDLIPIINKAQIEIAICDERLIDEIAEVSKDSSYLRKIYTFGDSINIDGANGFKIELSQQSTEFSNVETANDDVALIAFTSGTTGDPKGTLHYHRDVMSMCVCVGDELIKAGPDDVFIGSPPLAFTFGLGMQLTIPLHVGATTVLIENPSPPNLASAINEYQATICATAPTAYRAILSKLDEYKLQSLKKTVSAGEHLSLATFEAWERATGIRMINGLGTTEMIHIFVSASGEEILPGAIGKAVIGYEIAILDENGQSLPPRQIGKLAVKGPTGCKYLADSRQKNYVLNGWNITGDICEMDEQSYVWYHSRADDMIISAGYNIAGPEVESVLIAHDAVAECAVVGVPDAQRGTIVKAYIVLRNNVQESEELVAELQIFVKSLIAPYKYPREIEFTNELPKTQTGKLQRYKLVEN